MYAYLETDNSYGHHGQPYQRQSRLAPCETRVEETDTGNHQEYERCRYQNPRNVSCLWAERAKKKKNAVSNKFAPGTLLPSLQF